MEEGLEIVQMEFRGHNAHIGPGKGGGFNLSMVPQFLLLNCRMVAHVCYLRRTTTNETCRGSTFRVSGGAANHETKVNRYLQMPKL